MKYSLKPVTKFFNTEYVNWASYDVLRKIASAIDGQKNASRKILWYVHKKNLKNEIKVSQLDSKVADYTEYLHGSMSGVIVNLGCSYTGTNNINLLYPEGNFGTRIVKEASAPRYIYTFGTDLFFEIFNKQDDDILEHQIFEGKNIEPKFMLPVIPLILVNGASGVTSGFSQKIFSRDPLQIITYLKKRLKSRKYIKFDEKPYFRGYNGEVIQVQQNKYEIIGKIKRKNSSTVIIEEIPIKYELKSYKKVLNKLLETKKIQSYKDFSETNFKFEIKFKREVLDNLTDDELIEFLKLNQKETENYTVLDEHNKVRVFDDVSEIMDYYFDVKLKYIEKRKKYQIDLLVQDIKKLVSMYLFIKNVNDGNIVLRNRNTQQILQDIQKIKNIIPINGNYDYLLNMPIHYMSTDKMEELGKKIKDKKAHLDELKSKDVHDIWLFELENFEKKYKKYDFVN